MTTIALTPNTRKRKRMSAAKQRMLVAAAIERLVDLLDEIEPDIDLEPEPDNEPQGDEEPTMGWCNPTTGFLSGSEVDWTADQKDPGMDQSRLHVAQEDGELEPSLGWPEGMMAQSLSRLGSTSDREEQCEDEGAQCEDEGAEHDGSEPEGAGTANLDSEQYHTPEWRARMRREFGQAE